MNITAYLTTDFKDWTEFHESVIDERGTIIKKISNNAPVKFAVNLKHLLDFHPFDTMKESTFKIALPLLKEMSPGLEIDDDELLRNLTSLGLLK
jgi:hypothetical protein